MSKLGKYINQVLLSYRINTKLSHCRNPILLSLQKGPQYTSSPASRAHAMILGDPTSEMINLEAHRLTLAIAKKTLDENCFKTAQKTTDRQPPSRLVTWYNSKTSNPASRTSSGDQVTELSELSVMDTFLHIENQATAKV